MDRRGKYDMDHREVGPDGPLEGDRMAATSSPPIVVRLTQEDSARHFAADIRQGLACRPRWIPPKWLYDPLGCELFETITTLEEYYPTRAERAILEAHADDIAKLSGAATLIELGSGTSDKTLRLIDALSSAGSLERFVGFDVAEPTLSDALIGLARRYPTLELSGVVGDFERHLDALPDVAGRMIVLLGGTVGNLDPGRRAALLGDMAMLLHPGEHLLLGIDLVKDPFRLVAAYNDRQGVTERFERNILTVVNTTLGATFDPATFDYVARWVPKASRIEMVLRSRLAQRVEVRDLHLIVDLEAGENIQTEISTKFSVDGMAAELAAAGLGVVGTWTDPAGDFALMLAERR
ncbi:MAG: L-histidine N(alpha)-methyltransferase [Actinomycetota bacterium]|nr:L-histidine N(alpha)-methyltransferase [Actinomycetota bacterium]